MIYELLDNQVTSYDLAVEYIIKANLSLVVDKHRYRALIYLRHLAVYLLSVNYIFVVTGVDCFCHL